MCGRYILFNDDHAIEINAFLHHLADQGVAITPGEITPSGLAPVLLHNRQHKRVAQAMRWGWPAPHKPGLIINARAETVHTKAYFQDAFMRRRCIIPASGYYEWDHRRNKYLFTMPRSNILYMAGIYQAFAGQFHFCIITTAANASTKEIHDRMPLLLDEDALAPWLTDATTAQKILTAPTYLLDKTLALAARQQDLF